MTDGSVCRAEISSFSPINFYHSATEKVLSGVLMNASMEKQGEYTIVNLSGRLDINKTTPFKEVCLKSLGNQKLIFKFNQLSFVGSTGIHQFFAALQEIHSKNRFGLRVVGLSPDFKRFVGCLDEVKLLIHENVDQAKISFQFSGAGTPTFDSTQG